MAYMYHLPEEGNSLDLIYLCGGYRILQVFPGPGE